MLNGPLTYEDLKDRMKERYNIEKKNTHNLLYVEGGLAYSRVGKVVLEEKGVLYLNLKDGRALVKIIEYLEVNKEIGPKVKYLFEKVFVETFFSERGDGLFHEARLDYYLYREIEEQFGDDSVHNYDVLKEIQHRIFHVEFIEANDASWQKIEREVDELDILSILIGFTRDTRGDTAGSVPFMVGYILKVIELLTWEKNPKMMDKMIRLMKREEVIMEESAIADPIDLWNYVREREKEEMTEEDELFYWERTNYLTMGSYPNSAILDFLDKVNPRTIDIFIEKVVKKAVFDPVEIDSSLSRDDGILKLLLYIAS